MFVTSATKKKSKAFLKLAIIVEKQKILRSILVCSMIITVVFFTFLQPLDIGAHFRAFAKLKISLAEQDTNKVFTSVVNIKCEKNSYC